MTSRSDLLMVLADGHFHSGEELGARLGISRSAVWKVLKGVRASGVTVDAVSGRGYRLRRPLELLDEQIIRSHLSADSAAHLSRLDIHDAIDSTNSYLMQQAAANGQSGHACLAETQTAGRGRRGRPWQSPYGSNIYLSLLWRFDEAPASLPTLSLAIGVGVVAALESLQVEGVGLKWPNDVLWQGRKLAGILLEMAGETAGPCHVVMGLGLNCFIDDAAADVIDQPWVDLAHIGAAESLSRNRIAGALLDQMLDVMARFERDGFAAFVDQWRRLDVHFGQPIELSVGNQVIAGISRGIDENGALMVEQGGVVKRYMAGEISLRGVT